MPSGRYLRPNWMILLPAKPISKKCPSHPPKTMFGALEATLEEGLDLIY